jgi:23S rRNA (cytidine2498-2'-O)-methyltransferase
MQQLILTTNPDFAELALQELEQAAQHIQPAKRLAPGIYLVSLVQSWGELATTWQQQPPIFVRHLCPVQQVLPLQNELEADLARLTALVQAEIAPLLDPALSLSVQTRILDSLIYKPFDLNTALASALQSACGVTIHVQAPQQVLSLVCTGEPACAYIGLSLAADNLSNWAGGVHRFAREADQVSRSEFKLLEALDLFRIVPPPHGMALDLGAAPGGWTRILRQRRQYVTAVDPGELAPIIATDRHVRHRRMTAEAYLASDPDPFDLIVNDMRMDARDSARLMAAYAPYLYPNGLALMTLKLPEQQRIAVIEHTFQLLRQRYTIAGARQLFHNRSEITVLLRATR